jgi:putative transposase
VASEVDTGISSRQVARALERIMKGRRRARCAATMVPSSAAATSIPVHKPSHCIGVHPAGRPTQNDYIESFNGMLRDKCLNLNYLRNLNDARDRIGLILLATVNT